MASYSITVSPKDSGTVKILRVQEIHGTKLETDQNGVFHVANHAEIELQAVPSEGFEFRNWSWTASSSTKSSSENPIIMNEPHGGAIDCYFQENVETIELNKFIRQKEAEEHNAKIEQWKFEFKLKQKLK